jgi:hypothetical protein
METNRSDRQNRYSRTTGFSRTRRPSKEARRWPARRTKRQPSELWVKLRGAESAEKVARLLLPLSRLWRIREREKSPYVCQ